MITLFVVLSLGLIAVPLISNNMDPAPVASVAVNKLTVNYPPAPVIKSKFLTDVEQLGLTEYFNSITEKFKEFAKSKGINNIFVKWNEKENARRIEQTAMEAVSDSKTKENDELVQFMCISLHFRGSDTYLSPEQFVNILNKVTSKLKFMSKLATVKVDYEMFNKQTLVKPHYINIEKHNFIYLLWTCFLIENNKKILSPQFWSLDEKYRKKCAKPRPEPLSIPELNKLFTMNDELSRKLLSLVASHISTSKISISTYILMCMKNLLKVN